MQLSEQGEYYWNTALASIGNWDFMYRMQWDLLELWKDSRNSKGSTAEQ